MAQEDPELFEVGFAQLGQYLDLDGVVAKRLGVSLQREPAQPVGDFQGPSRSGSCIARRCSLTRFYPHPKEEDDAGNDVPQPALQHLAQDPGAAAREGVEPTIIEYLKSPYTAAQLKQLLGQLKMPASKLVRKKEAAAAGIDPAALSEDELIQAMAKNPIIVERPIVVSGGKAALGRPPEAALSVL